MKLSLIVVAASAIAVLAACASRSERPSVYRGGQSYDQAIHAEDVPR